MTLKKWGYVLALLALLAAPAVLYPVLVMKVLLYALFACSFNLLIGFAGLVSFGHATFFGGAAYFCGYALASLGMPTEAGILLGTGASALIGLVVGGLAIRRQGVYFSMITLALAQMLYFFYLQAPFTGGEDGLQAIPRGTLLGFIDLHNDLTLYYVVLAIVLAGFGLMVRTVHSPFGQVLQAIKDNEPRALSLGYDVARYKLVAFVLSATLAGLAGATKSVVLGAATLTDVHWAMSGLVILMTLIGGMGTFVGPIFGAAIIVALESKLGDIGDFLAAATGIEWFRAIGVSVPLVTGLIFMACVMLFRRGILGELAHALRPDRPRPEGPPHG
ncbi:leucine/isoleucine/valine transporter permease subunit (plasmid) [Variovorax sp. SRS16]|uniref:branched-chain amino acid ABC transporter permease n=1 Tax=Variovorax sp. SRS16 TaxID=282217 RepID=UPI00131781DA|nr:branched-chain amino acid ABC transporter permease [Variovorax sp. SRS16]VTU45699.1 leucine/isoleucine/valine transporter permease subunit [Variovorax sp. SRS16]